MTPDYVRVAMSEPSCLYWDGRGYQLACADDLCHGSDETLCGLFWGEDFDVNWGDDGWDDNWSRAMLTGPMIMAGLLALLDRWVFTEETGQEVREKAQVLK